MRKKSKKKLHERRSLFFSSVAILLCVVGAMAFSDGTLPPVKEFIETLKTALFKPASATIKTNPKGDLSVHFIDVGQGDCTLIQAGDQNILVDAGERGNSEKIIQYLNSCDVQQFDLIVATHPHSDHIGSLPEVLKEFGAKAFLIGNVPQELTPTTRIYEKLLDTAAEQSVEIKDVMPGMEYKFDNGAQITMVGPVPDKAKDINNTSAVFRLDFGETSFLFTGDAEKESEEEILSGAYREKLDADVLKLGHHGSNTSTMDAWLKKVDPVYAVALVGKDNDYGHPHRDVLQRLDSQNITLYRSDLHGNIVFTSDGLTLEVQTQY